MSRPSQSAVLDVEKQFDPNNTVPTAGRAVSAAEEYHSSPAESNGMVITSIILCITGVGFGVAGGYCADASHPLEFDREWANMFLGLSFIFFKAATPIFLILGHKRNRGSEEGFPSWMLIAWVAYLCGMVFSLILLVVILNLEDLLAPWLYYLALMCNFVPYLVMMMRQIKLNIAGSDDLERHPLGLGEKRNGCVNGIVGGPT